MTQKLCISVSRFIQFCKKLLICVMFFAFFAFAFFACIISTSNVKKVTCEIPFVIKLNRMLNSFAHLPLLSNFLMIVHPPTCLLLLRTTVKIFMKVTAELML